MSRKDYVLIAEAIASVVPGSNRCQKGWSRFIAHRIAEAMKQGNPRFDKATFMQACKLDVASMKDYGVDINGNDK
jgi:hypothetical protein